MVTHRGVARKAGSLLRPHIRGQERLGEQATHPVHPVRRVKPCVQQLPTAVVAEHVDPHARGMQRANGRGASESNTHRDKLG